MTKNPPDFYIDYWETGTGDWIVAIFDKDGKTLREERDLLNKRQARQRAIEILAEHVSGRPDHMESDK